MSASELHIKESYVFYDKLKLMKRLFFIFLAFAFVFNTVSLSTFAAVCPHGSAFVQDVHNDQQDQMPCHEMAGETTKDSEKPPLSGHCEGMCFCLQAALSHNIMISGADALFSLPVSVKTSLLPTGSDVFSSKTVSPLDRPPKS